MLFPITLGDIFIFLLSSFILFLFTFILYARWNYGSLEAMGIPVVKPHWFLGSNYNYMKLIHHWEDFARAKQLGPVFGIYDGRTPFVFISDPELIYRTIFSESDHFKKREHDFGNPVINENIEFQNGEKWKAIHSLLSPQFTSGQVKTKSEVAKRVSQEYVEFLKTSMDSDGRVSKVNLHEFLAPFAIQLIAEMLCGIKITDPRDPENSFVKNMRACLFDGFKFDWTWNLMQVFPFLLRLLPLLDTTDRLSFLVENVTNILDQREKSQLKISDTVSVLVEMRQKTQNDPTFAKLGIGLDSVFAQSFEFFAASYIGTVGTLEELCYFLATQPDIYTKLMAEIDSVQEVSYDSISKMEYLEGCISETLRIAPGFFRPERTCVKDWSTGDPYGVTIKAGTHVTFPIYAVHHNPDLYPEPEKFMPERFMGENKDKIARCSFLSFGIGQRQCLGRRLVYPILKMFMVSILKEFDIEKRQDTKWVENPGSHMTLMLDPLYVDFVKRKQ